MNLNYLAPLSSLGYGQIAINLLSALSKNKVNISLFPIGGIENPIEHHKESLNNSLNNSLNFDYNAPSLRLYHQFDMAQSVGKGLKSGMTFFELNKLNTREIHHLNYLDVIFSPTQWAKQVMIENGITTKIEVVNPGIDLEVFNNIQKKKIKTKTENTTVFMNIGKWMRNKGHDFLLEAFNNAFTKDDDVLLVMGCFNPVIVNNFNGPKESKRWEYLYMNSQLGLAEKIQVIPGRLNTQIDIATLMDNADCGFFPARCEGWNLPACELLSLGKSCIITNYSAHTEYAEKSGCHLINIKELEDCYEPPFFQSGSGQWAKLDKNEMDQSVEFLRKIHKLKQENNLQKNCAGYNLFRVEKTWDNTAKQIITHIYN